MNVHCTAVDAQIHSAFVVGAGTNFFNNTLPVEWGVDGAWPSLAFLNLSANALHGGPNLTASMAFMSKKLKLKATTEELNITDKADRQGSH